MAHQFFELYTSAFITTVNGEEINFYIPTMQEKNNNELHNEHYIGSCMSFSL